MADVEGILQVGHAFAEIEAGLRPAEFSAAQIAIEREAEAARDGGGEKFSLIEAAMPALEPVHGHGQNHVEALVAGQGCDHEAAQGQPKAFDPRVFEKVD